MKEMEEFILDNLKKMICIESRTKGSMDEMIDFTTELLEEIGLEPRVIKCEDHNPVIVASTGEGVCFSGHLDTVPIGEGWEHGQGEIDGERIYGRGALDMKGPCMAAVAAAKRLVDDGTPFSLVFTTDEEVSMSGAEKVAAEPEIKKAPAVVVCEPTEKRIVTQEKGLYQFEITTEGKNAHASMPEKGENAIVKMLPILSDLNLKNNIPADENQMTCCIDVIEGGDATNVIPDKCRAEVDVRYPSAFTQETLKKYLFGPIDQDFGVKTIQHLDPVRLDEKMDCVQRMISIADTETWSVPYGTEMVMFSQENEKTFVFGPGNVDMAHKPDEYIEWPKIVDIVDIYVDYAKKMLEE